MKSLILVAPTFAFDSVVDFDQGRPLAMTVSGPPGMSGSASTLIERGPQVRLGKHIFTGDLALMLRVDHPDAMPVEFVIRGMDFASVGTDLVARPLIQFQPIRSRILLSKAPSGALGGGTSRRPFEGTIKLLRIDRRGLVDTLDAKAAGTRRGKEDRTLRMDGPPGPLFVAAIPSEGRRKAGALADLIQLDASGKPVQALSTAARARTGTPQKFTVVDPFGEPMEDVRIGASFLTENAAMFTTKGVPVVVDGHLFYRTGSVGTPPGPAGQQLVRGEIQGSELTLIRGGASDTTQGDGSAELLGLVLGPFEYALTTPLVGESFPMLEPVESTAFVHQVMAPVVGLEVLCPVEWRGSSDGLEAWSRAKLRVEVNVQELGKRLRGLQMKTTREVSSPPEGPARQERFLLAPEVPYTVTCEASGWPPFTAKVPKTPRGAVVTALPKAPLKSD